MRFFKFCLFVVVIFRLFNESWRLFLFSRRSTARLLQMDGSVDTRIFMLRRSIRKLIFLFCGIRFSAILRRVMILIREISSVVSFLFGCKIVRKTSSMRKRIDIVFLQVLMWILEAVFLMVLFKIVLIKRIIGVVEFLFRRFLFAGIFFESERRSTD